MFRRLYSACGSKKKEIWIVPGGSHNNTYSVAGSIYVTRLQAFFWKCRSLKREPPSKVEG